MQHFRIPDHLGLCAVDGHMLLLDLRRDLYLELDRDSAAAFHRWREEPETEASDPGLRRLVERGLLVAADRQGEARWTERGLPTRSLLDTHAPGGSAWRLAPEVAALLWGARRRLARGLEQAVARVRRSRPTSEPREPGPALARYLAARRLVPIAPNCLTDSLALAAFLAPRGIACDLVFGVKRDPFAAHCWLQIGDAVVNDAVDNISCFTPILVA